MTSDKFQPLVTIITASYNSEKYISETIKSVLRQDYPAIEYIIIDGGSTDRTIEIIKSYEPHFGGKLRWLSEPDKGIYDAYNKGIRMASGCIVGIINSDDWYEDGIIKQVAEIIDDYDMVHGNLRFVNAEGQVLKIYSQKKGWLKKFISTPFNHNTMFVRKRVYDGIGLYNTDYPLAADYDFMLRFIESNYEDLYVDRILVTMRAVGVTSSATGVHNQEEYKNILVDNGLSLITASIFVYYRVIRVKLYQIFKKYPRLIDKLRKYNPYHLDKNRLQ